MTAPVVARGQVLTAAVLFSTGGAVVKAIDLGGWQIACFRSSVAAVVIFTLVGDARRLRDRRVWLVGLAYAATLLLFVNANKLTTAANAIFLQATAPLYTVLLAPVLLQERAARRDLPLMAVLAVGLALFFVGQEPGSAIASDPPLGNLLGLLSGVTWALTLIGLKWIAREGDADGSAPAVVAGNALAAALALPFALPCPIPTASDLAGIAFLGVAQIGLAYLLLIRGLPRVRALEASLLLLAEPVLSPLWSWLIHAEIPTGTALIGCAIILIGTAVHTFARSAGGRSRPGNPQNR